MIVTEISLEITAEAASQLRTRGKPTGLVASPSASLAETARVDVDFTGLQIDAPVEKLNAIKVDVPRIEEPTGV